jgi:hypothetical protein
VNDVLTGVGRTISVPILAGHYEKCEQGTIKHYLEARYGADSSCGLGIEFVAFDTQSLRQEVLQGKPDV